MRTLTYSRPQLKLFLTARESLDQIISKELSIDYHISMQHAQAEKAVSTYVDLLVEDVHRNGDLIVGSSELLQKSDTSSSSKHKACEFLPNFVPATSSYADIRRFLWVAFQVEDLCLQTCDDDIVAALKRLPRDLPETYARILKRIMRNGRSSIAQQIFKWVTIAKNPLTLKQLCEAIAIEPCQTSANPGRVMNNALQMVCLCESLIVKDEEDDVVQFTHATVRSFLLEPKLGTSLRDFSFDERELDIQAGEICVTYLNFSDFERALVRTDRKALTVEPSRILAHALIQTNNDSFNKTMQLLLRPYKTDRIASSDVVRRVVDDLRDNTQLLQTYSFLRYASKFWLAHTSLLSLECRAWKLFSNLLDSESRRCFAPVPWTTDEWAERSDLIVEWIGEMEHTAVLEYIMRSSKPFSPHNLELLFTKAVQARCVPLIQCLLREPTQYGLDMEQCLEVAIVAGDSYAVGWILKTEVKLSRFGRAEAIPKNSQSYIKATQKSNASTFLQIASAMGHLDIVEKLIDRKVDVNQVVSGDEPTALHYAADMGHEEIVRRLVRSGAKVNAAMGFWKLTPLGLAARNGHTSIVECLLQNGVNINTEYYDHYDVDRDSLSNEQYSPISLTCSFGHADTVRVLLDALEKPNLRSLLTLAKAGGHQEIIDILQQRQQKEIPVHRRRTE